ncbi:hypothetical protein [Spirillospora sp. NPDC029432]|uniref:hypothetical protein n=1 Tax=Spirillospora sp. NPDC029432 TaxID=3154599 RepID=UPI003455B7A6
MTRDRDQQPSRFASADDAFLEVTGSRANARRVRGEGTRRTPGGRAAPRGAAEGTDDQEAQEAKGDREDAVGATAARDDRAEPGPAPEPDAERDRDPGGPDPEEVRDHLRRRAIFLRELAEARELRERVTPHRSRRARIHAALRRRTFRLH